MQKVIVGIFAHPDDEAFGPSGTLLKMANEGYDIFLVLLTDGGAGMNPDNVKDLSSVRLDEWRSATRILQAKQTFALHYPDGGLKNVAADELDQHLQLITDEILAQYISPTQLEIMTFEPQGLTGHRDHIAATQVAVRLADRLKVHKVWYFCLHHSQAPLGETPYCEPSAREDNYITHEIDVSHWLSDKMRAIDAHATQRADAEKFKQLGNELLSLECFCVATNPE